MKVSMRDVLNQISEAANSESFKLLQSAVKSVVKAMTFDSVDGDAVAELDYEDEDGAEIKVYVGGSTEKVSRRSIDQDDIWTDWLDGYEDHFTKVLRRDGWEASKVRRGGSMMAFERDGIVLLISAEYEKQGVEQLDRRGGGTEWRTEYTAELAI